MSNIFDSAPEQEPERQLYFIDKAKTLTFERAERLGKTLTYHVETFGCQMNARDSEKLRGVLEEVGFNPSEDEKADFVLYNTCTVRENANNRVYGRLGTLGNYKKKNPDMLIAMCGCMPQEEHCVEALKTKYKFVNLVFGTHNIYRFPELLCKTLISEDKQTVEIWKDGKIEKEALPTARKYSFKSGVNIMYGCNNFCSYCIVPYVRGRERSRTPEDIIEEIISLSKSGVREIMLLGQNVNSYGIGLDNSITFAELLKKIEKIEGIKRIRFMTSHPKDLSDELIETIAASEKICRHFHLPLQSGSSRVLKAMNRKYDKERYLSIVEKLRKAVPDISLTTDIIVGFPGETEEDFLETMDVVEKARFDSAFTFIYSKRTGTPAAEMKDQVPEDVVKDRFDRLLKLVQTIGSEKAYEKQGLIMPVLVEQINEQDSSLVSGRLSNNSIVHFPGDKSLIGEIVNVRLDKCMGFYYLGEAVND